MVDYIRAFQGKVDHIAANDLADNGTSEGAEIDNGVAGELGGWAVVKVNDGTGAHADGWTLYMRGNVDDGTTDSDANTYVVGWGPSPNSGTIIRKFRVDTLPDRYWFGVINETAAAVDFDVDWMPDHIES